MTAAEVRQAAAELDLARWRRELLFWTMSWWLTMIVLTAMTISFVGSAVFSLLHGTGLHPTQIALGGAGVGGQLVLLLRRASSPTSPKR